MDSSPVPFLAMTLANGLELTVTDRSRPLAGDRWLVRLACELRLPPDKTGALLAELPPETPVAAVGERLCREGVLQVIVRERNFIAAAEVDGAREELLRNLTGPLLSYLQSRSYPERMLARRLQELRSGPPAPPPADDREDEEESGPADFSHLFR
ncbi:MAG: hypothetical protein AB1568_10225 [Thermodesulfobacteriota bacterium]